jgi:phosphoribosyl-AMP cyclohydrolase
VCDGSCPERVCKTKREDARRGTGGLFYARPRLKEQMNLDFTKLDGLIPAVIQDHRSGRVLMVGFMNDEAFRKTTETGNVTFYSRSRNKLWMKGESSGHLLVVKEISTDCDDDSLLIKVDSLGPGVCHNGYQSCFYRRFEDGKWVESESPTYDPNAVYGGTK